MHPSSVDLIADFTQRGGRVVRLQQSIPVSVVEVLDYLGTRGLSANYSPGRSKLFYCNGKPLNLGKLITLANQYRSYQQLPPFVARIPMAVARRR